jgi:transcription antitermination factor NusG
MARGRAGKEDDWCILRCSGRHTLRLAESLAKDGYDVWTPKEERSIRIPRANARRKVELPIMPTYVFAKAHHLVDLLELAAMPVKPRRGAGLREAAHASFSVLHHHDKIPLIADKHFAQLRILEAKRAPLKKAKEPYTVGIGVKVAGGSFGGLKGKVERSDCKHTVVCFTDSFTVKIATSLLEPDSVCSSAVAASKAA